MCQPSPIALRNEVPAIVQIVATDDQEVNGIFGVNFGGISSGYNFCGTSGTQGCTRLVRSSKFK